MERALWSGGGGTAVRSNTTNYPHSQTGYFAQYRRGLYEARPDPSLGDVSHTKKYTLSVCSLAHFKSVDYACLLLTTAAQTCARQKMAVLAATTPISI